MSTIAILVGFALMLFLPVGIAVMRVREQDDEGEGDAGFGDSAYADGTDYADGVAETLMAERFRQAAVPEAALPLAYGAYGEPYEELESGDASDPLALGRGPKAQGSRVERAEMDALRAQALAARAQADALAAVARAALVRAEEAAFEAMTLEREAALAIEDLRRAA